MNTTKNQTFVVTITDPLVSDPYQNTLGEWIITNLDDLADALDRGRFGVIIEEN